MNVHSPDCLTTAVGYGTNCEFECDRGYTTPIDVDHVNRSCQADSKWGGSDFNCSGKGTILVDKYFFVF